MSALRSDQDALVRDGDHLHRQTAGACLAVAKATVGRLRPDHEVGAGPRSRPSALRAAACRQVAA